MSYTVTSHAVTVAVMSYTVTVTSAMFITSQLCLGV